MKPADHSINELVKACAHSADTVEWTEFLTRCTPVVSAAAAHITRRWTGSAPPSQVLDIVQEVFLRLCERERRILCDFVPHGDVSFFALLRVVSASVANDYFRRQYSAKRGARHTTSGLADQAADPSPRSSSAGSQMQTQVLLSEIDSRLKAARNFIPTRDRAIFWLYYRHGFTAEEIAALPAVRLSPKGVESVLRRVTRWLNRMLEPAGKVTVPLSAEEST